MNWQDVRLLQFVDRTAEMECFAPLLQTESPPRPLVIVTGVSGMGKSNLLLRMQRECERVGTRQVVITWTETINFGYLHIMRLLRDELAPNGFPNFSERADYFTNPGRSIEVDVHVTGNVSVGQQATISGTVGDITGIKFQDARFTAPRADLAISPQDIRAQLTGLFLDEFEVALGSVPAVLFLDAFELAAEETRKWVVDALVGRLIEQKLANVRVVIAGQRKPELPYEAWRRAEDLELGILKQSDIAEYATKTGLAGLMKADPAEIAVLLEASSNGIPASLASYVDTVIRKLEKRIR